MVYYSLSYFNVYNNAKLFSLLNAAAVLFGGAISSIGSGIICDKYEPVNYKTKAYVTTFQSLIAVPLLAVAYLCHKSFALSMTFVFLEYMLAEGWVPSTVAMIVTCIDAKYKGRAIGIFQFSIYIFGTIGVFVNSLLINEQNGDNNPIAVGKVIAFNTCIPCLLAAFCYWRAGIHYEIFKINQEKKVDKAIEKAEAFHVNLLTESIRSLQKMDLNALRKDSIWQPNSPFKPFLAESSESNLMKSRR